MALGSIDQFEVREVRVGVMGYRRRVLFVHEVKGTNRKLEAVNARPSTSPNPIDAVAARFNGFLREMRSGTVSG